MGPEGLEEVVKSYMKQVNTKENISIMPFNTAVKMSKKWFMPLKIASGS